MKRKKRIGGNPEPRARALGIVGMLVAALIVPVLTGGQSSRDDDRPGVESGNGIEAVMGSANPHQIDSSGVQARIQFVDDGTMLMVIGTATGLDPNESYLSNIYDIRSAPGGAEACEPTIFDPGDPDFILPTMFLGFWTVDADGSGTLFAINTNFGLDYVPLDKIGTVSVRLFVAPPMVPGAPPVTELVACGKAAEERTTEVLVGKANLHQIDNSGVKARIQFVDDGMTLTVTGTAAGLDPAESYVTLIYDNGSVPSGPRACQPTIFNPEDPDFLLATMFIGFWTVDEEGRGTLETINTNFGLDYVPLDKFRNTSVRLVIGPPPKGSVIPMTELVACGHVSESGGD